MKNTKYFLYVTLPAFMLLCLPGFSPLMAQNVEEPVTPGYEIPGRPMTAAWIWIVGIAVFLVLLISILRPRKKVRSK